MHTGTRRFVQPPGTVAVVGLVDDLEPRRIFLDLLDDEPGHVEHARVDARVSVATPALVPQGAREGLTRRSLQVFSLRPGGRAADRAPAPAGEALRRPCGRCRALNASRGGFGARRSASTSALLPVPVVPVERGLARRLEVAREANDCTPCRREIRQTDSCDCCESGCWHEVALPPRDGQHEQRGSEHSGERCDAEHEPAELEFVGAPCPHREGSPREPKRPGHDEGSSTAPHRGPAVAETQRVGDDACEDGACAVRDEGALQRWMKHDHRVRLPGSGQGCSASTMVRVGAPPGIILAPQTCPGSRQVPLESCGARLRRVRAPWRVPVPHWPLLRRGPAERRRAWCCASLWRPGHFVCVQVSKSRRVGASTFGVLAYLRGLCREAGVALVPGGLPRSGQQPNPDPDRCGVGPECLSSAGGSGRRIPCPAAFWPASLCGESDGSGLAA